MRNRKNSVAIQSYSAKANKPEPEEKKRVSHLDFTVISTDIRPRVEMMWSDISQRRLTQGQREENEGFWSSRFSSLRFSHSPSSGILTKDSTVTPASKFRVLNLFLIALSAILIFLTLS